MSLVISLDLDPATGFKEAQNIIRIKISILTMLQIGIVWIILIQVKMLLFSFSAADYKIKPLGQMESWCGTVSLQDVLRFG
jgi:hypothetical protein